MNATANDTGSGLAALEASVGGSTWSAFTTPLLFNNGQHSYQFRAIDYAGNITETPLQGLGVDTIPPVIDLPASWILGQTVTFKLQDDGSGLAGLRLVIEDEDERYPKVAWDDGLSGNKFKGEIAWNGRFKDGSQALPGGEYYAWLKVTDNAGNERMQAGQIIVEDVVPLLSDLPDTPVSATEAPASVEPESIVPQSPLPLPTNMPPAASFGGSNNTMQLFDTQSGKMGFNAGGSSNSPVTSSQSNILWGATATAAIGAFAAEIARRKETEKAAKRARSAEREEIRAASNYRQKVKANKLDKLEKKWAAERALAEQRQGNAVGT